MKRVPVEIARYLRDAGYPLEIKLIEEAEKLGWQGKAFFTGTATCALLPTYMEVWQWLWKEKKMCYGIDNAYINIARIYTGDGKYIESTSPEESIEVLVKHLVENDLIK